MSEDKKQLHFMLLKLLHFVSVTLIFYYTWLIFRYGAVSGLSRHAFR